MLFIKTEKRKRFLKSVAAVIMTGMMAVAAFGCGSKTGSKLSSDDPEEVTIWLSGSERRNTAYLEMIDIFNEGLGKERGIIVKGETFGSENELNEAFENAFGSDEETDTTNRPSMIALSAKNSILYDKRGGYLDINDIIAEDTKNSIFESLLHSGTYGSEGELRLLPVVKDTYVMAVNLNSWNSFKEKDEHYLSELEVWEGLTSVSDIYYSRMDKSLFGIHDIPGYIFTGNKQLGTPFLSIENGKSMVRTDGESMKRIWETYYIPFVMGGGYRKSQDPIEDLQSENVAIAMIPSSRASELGTETATEGDAVYFDRYEIAPYPQFKGGDKVCPVDDTGVAVVNINDRKNLASIVFLEWLLEKENNMTLAELAGAVPVNKYAADASYYEELIESGKSKGSDMDQSTMRVSLEMMDEAVIFAEPVCDELKDMYDYMKNGLYEEAFNDRKVIDESVFMGLRRKEAAESYISDEHFRAWFSEFKDGLPE